MGLSSSIALVSNDGNTSNMVCTGWMVGQRQLITTQFCANHVGGLVKKLRATFSGNGDRSNQSPLVLTLKEKALYTDESLDYSLLEVANKGNFGIRALTITRTPPKAEDSLFIVHFAEGKDQKYSVKPCKIIAVQEKRITHNCDTAGGTSGAPLISAETLGSGPIDFRIGA